MESNRPKSILDLEDKYSDSISFDESWFIHRIYLGLHLKSHSQGTLNKKKSKKKISRWISLMLMNIKSTFDIHKLFQKYDEIFFTDSSQWKKFNVLEDRLFSSIQKQINKKKVSIVRSNKKPLPVQINTNDTVHINDFFLKAFIEFISFFIQCSQSYPFFIRELGIEKELKKNYKRVKAQEFIYTQLFKFWKPNRIYLSCHYINQGIVLAAKKCDIRIIEAQHGVIATEHFAFYSKLKPLKNFFPDVLLSFGRIDTDNFLISTYEVIGSKYLEHIDLKVKKEESSYDVIFSVTLQQEDWEEKEMLEWVVFNAKKYKNFYFIVIPRFSLESNELEGFENVEISNDDVYITICKSDIHVTLYSSCAIESGFFGIPNLLVDSFGFASRYYEHMLDEHSSKFIKKEDEIHNTVMELKKISRDEIKINNDSLVAREYKKRMNNFIKNEYS
tara:strand:- start:15151 stop:16485 length:1335 start_codon:yes stop_codon:yes gene_type:complete